MLPDYRQKDIVDRLSEFNPFGKHQRMQHVRLSGTGDWALRLFDEFMQTNGPSMIICTGIGMSRRHVYIKERD
jgi:hypothetical protein